MVSHRLNLRLPINLHINERPSSERPSSRTDKLVEASFSSEAPIECSTPKLSASSSTKTLTSVNKLKDLLQKTSDKLKGIQTKPERLQLTETNEKASEILRLKREVRILEMEKKELEAENRKLQENLMIYKNPVPKGEDQNALIRYSKFFLSAVKGNKESLAVFQEVFNDEDQFLAKVGMENLTGLAVGLLQFSLDSIARCTQGSEIGGSVKTRVDDMVQQISVKYAGKEVNDESLKRIFIQSQNLSQNIVNQRARIEQAYVNVKDTISSGRLSVTPTGSRPQSSASNSRKAAETPKHMFTPMMGFREKSQSLKDHGSESNNLIN